jgi:hypothetical protein
MDHNPFVVMDNYSRESLESMTLEELLAAQRSVMFPHEQEKFDQGESVFLKLGDGREEFLDFTDCLIQDHQGLQKGNV